MVRWLVLLWLVPRLAVADPRPALAFEAKEIEIAAKRGPKDADIGALVAAAYPTATAVEALTGTTPVVMFLRVMKLDVVTRTKQGWGREPLMIVLGCVGTYTLPETGAARVRCIPEITTLTEQDGAWTARWRTQLARLALDWRIAGGNSASTYMAAIGYWPVAKQSSQLLEVGVVHKAGGERSKETTTMSVYWLEDAALREVLSLSYTSAEQGARGRRSVVNTISEYDGHATRSVPDLEVREQVTSHAGGRERMTVRAFSYKWNGKSFERAGSHPPRS
jgi:hypothetical protein